MVAAAYMQALQLWTTRTLQAVNAAVGQGPLDASPANAVAALEALKQLPSQQAAVLEHVDQIASQASSQKQQARLALIDAQADLQACLAEAQAEGSSISHALQLCLLAAANKRKVSTEVKPSHTLKSSFINAHLQQGSLHWSQPAVQLGSAADPAVFNAC